MCSKVNAVCMILFLLLLLFTFSSAARPEPSASFPYGNSDDLHVKTQHLEGEAEKVDEGVEMDSCQGIEEEECLMRRTLAAHIDYIYTQKSKP